MDTAKRQNWNVKITKAEWRHRYMAAIDIPEFSAWGAIVDEKLAAAFLSFRYKDRWEGLALQSKTEYIKKNVNNALIFNATPNLMKDSGVKFCFATIQSLDAAESVDAFKFRLGYRPKLVLQRIKFNPFYKPFANPVSKKFLGYIRKLQPGNVFISKANVLLSHYLEGRKPISEQKWPSCLLEKKQMRSRK